MKKFFGGLVVVAMMLFPVAIFAGGSKASEGAGDAQKGILIGYSFPTVNNEFWGLSLQNLQDAAKQLGFTLMAQDCNNDQTKQVNDVDSMLSSGINGLVLAPQDASVCPGIIAKCKQRNIPVVVVDRWPGDDLKAGIDYICFIGPNDEEAGYNIAKNLIAGGSNKLLALGGFQNTSVAEGRKAGLDKALRENPQVTLLQYEWAGENMDQGDAAFRPLMSRYGNDVNGVWCYNDSLALAAVNVLKEMNKIKTVKTGGMDLLGPALDSMQRQELYLSTGGHYMQSAFGAIVVFDALNGIKYSGQSVTKLDLITVTQQNLSQFTSKFDKPNAVDWKSYSRDFNPNGDIKFVLEF
jgi:simple sugar transport system substrate-binding protein